MPFGSSTCDGTPRNCYSLQPDYLIRVYLQDVSSGMTTATLDSMAYDYTPTDLWMWEVSASTYASIIVKEDDYGDNGFAAWVNCPDSSTTQQTPEGRTCSPQVVKYNRNSASYLAVYYNGSESRDSIACHELGHSVGLGHSTNELSCMEPGDPDGSTVLSTHDVNTHINPHYGD